MDISHGTPGASASSAFGSGSYPSPPPFRGVTTCHRTASLAPRAAGGAAGGGAGGDAGAGCEGRGAAGAAGAVDDPGAALRGGARKGGWGKWDGMGDFHGDDRMVR